MEHSVLAALLICVSLMAAFLIGRRVGFKAGREDGESSCAWIVSKEGQELPDALREDRARFWWMVKTMKEAGDV
jgi:hypothetical protein